jgi:hypothetical protein
MQQSNKPGWNVQERSLPGEWFGCSSVRKGKQMVENYYTSRKDSLMRDFDKASKILEQVLTVRYGAEPASTIRKETRQEFEALIPQLPYIGGKKNRHTRSVIGTSYGLALYRALTARAKSVDEIGAIHYSFSKAVLASLPLPSKLGFWFLRVLLSTRPGKYLFKIVLKRRVRISQERRIPGNVVGRYVEGQGDEFDCGVDITECPIADFFHAQNAAEFAPYVCLYDFPASALWGTGLVRTMTLAEGAEKCDDRFRLGQEPINRQKTKLE